MSQGWGQGGTNITDSAESRPTEQSKPSSVGFEGAPDTESSKDAQSVIAGPTHRKIKREGPILTGLTSSPKGEDLTGAIYSCHSHLQHFEKLVSLMHREPSFHGRLLISPIALEDEL